MTTALNDYTVFRYLSGAGLPLRASARLGAGVFAAIWDRDETAEAFYDDPNHHTLSLYVSGGDQFFRRRGDALLPSFGAGSLCLMPQGASSQWDVSGPIRMFHFYFSRQALERAVGEATRAERPAALREIPYFRDSALEDLIRSAVLPLDWDEPSERIAAGEAGEKLLAYVAARLTERPGALRPARGGLPPATLRRIADYVAAHCGEPIGLAELATIAGASPYHFARAFKRSTGESPHAFVTRQRVERAEAALRGRAPLAEIARRCGFGGPSHFAQRFREATGLTPSQYRPL